MAAGPEQALAMPEDSSPWPLRWIVDEYGRDTGFAMLRRPLQSVEEAAFEKMASDHRLIGFTHYGPLPAAAGQAQHRAEPPPGEPAGRVEQFPGPRELLRAVGAR